MNKQVQLTRLTLTNYRNIENATYVFNGNSKIIGENRIGKTNTLEAIIWLLTDHLLNGNTDITAIKPLSDTSKVVSVEGTFEIDGHETTIKKEYREKWVKTRGSETKEMQGHETIYYVNEVKQPTMRAYNNEINSEFGIDTNVKANIDIKRLLVDPYYLGDLGESADWKEFRSFIIDIVGDVSDEDVFEQNPMLELARKPLAKQNGRIDQAKKYTNQQIANIKKDIMVNEGSIAELGDIVKPTEEEITIAKKGIEECETNIAMLRANNGTDEVSHSIEEELIEVRSSIADVKEKVAKLNDPSKDKVIQINNEITDLNNKVETELNKRETLLNERSTAKHESGEVEYAIKNCVRNRVSLIERIKEIDKAISEAPNKVITECPHCHRSYDQSEIDKAINDNIAKLENDKASLIEQGKENNKIKSKHEEDLIIKNEAVEVIDVQINKIDSIIEEYNNAINSKKEEMLICLNNKPIDNPYEEELNKLSAQRLELETKLQQSRQDFAQGCQDINSKIYEEQSKMKPYKQVLADMDYWTRTQSRIQVLKEKGEDLGRQLASEEQIADLLNVFIRKKLEVLDEHVSKVFGNIKFQLIRENINGGYDTICKPYIYDVDKDQTTSVTWKSGSKSERVLTGVSILERIKEALQLPDMPILFDEGGEISTDTFDTKFKTNSQLVCVQVVDGLFKPTIVSIK